MKYTFTVAMQIVSPLLIAAFPVLQLYVYNIQQLSIWDVLWPLFFIEASVLLLLFFTEFVLRSKSKASLIVSPIIFLLLSYLHVVNVLKAPPSPLVGKGEYIPLLLLFSIIIWIVLVLRNYLNETSAHRFFFATGLFLVFLNVFNITRYELTKWDQMPLISANDAVLNTSTDNFPDVYYLIFDRYPNNKTLRKFYDTNNESFLSSLNKLGFYVIPDARTNYATTNFSLASSLNMTYVHDFLDLDEMQIDITIIKKLIADNMVMRLLKKTGYKYIHFGSWWNETSSNPNAERNVNIRSLSAFQMLLLRYSIVGSLCDKMDICNKRRLQWKRLHFQFQELPQIADDPSPTFVFAHFLIPHPPYVIDTDGSFLSKGQLSVDSSSALFLKQLRFANTKILETVRLILEKSPSPPIIVLQADEGPYLEDNGAVVDINNDDQIQIRTGILNALYLPGVDSIPKNMTPVNTFRMIFSEYFDVNFPLLRNRIFVFDDTNRRYLPKEVKNWHDQ